MLNLLFLLFAGYATGLLLPLCFPAKPRIQNILAHGSAGLASGAGILLGITGLFAQEPWTASVQSAIPFLSFAVRIDPLASFFVLTISLAGVAASIYALGYVIEFYGRASIAALGALFNGFLLSMTLVVIADNGFFFLIAWELISLLSYFLVVTEHKKAEVRYAGLFYLITTHVGTAFIILAFLIFFQAGGRLVQGLPPSGAALVRRNENSGFSDCADRFWYQSGHCAAACPVTLPYPAAPSHISALMSGVIIKTAIDALIRVYFDFLGGQFPWWWGFVVLVVGAVSALLGVMYALMEHDLKRLLAFHSMENIGIILLGIGAGMIFQSYGLKELAALGRGTAVPYDQSCGVQGPAVLRRWLAAVRDSHTRHGGVWRPSPTYAFDWGFLFDRSRLDFRATSHQWICQRVAGLPKSLSQFSASDGVSETDASNRRGHVGLDRCVSPGLFCEGLRHFVSGSLPKLPCAPCRRSPDPDAGRDGNPGRIVRRTWIGSHDRGAAP